MAIKGAVALARRAGVKFEPGIGAFRSGKTGRFVSTVEAANLTFSRPHGDKRCGKGQYKSLECKQKAIAARVQAGFNITARQKKYLGDLT